MTVGEKIQYYRKKAKLSQEDLGRELMLSRQTVSLWETGQTVPTIDNLIRLKEIFGVSIDEMLCVEEPSEKKTEHLSQTCLGTVFKYSINHRKRVDEKSARFYSYVHINLNE